MTPEKLKKMDDEAIKRWGSWDKIILALFGILFVVAISWLMTWIYQV